MPTDLSLEVTDLFRQVIEAKQQLAEAQERFASLQQELIATIESKSVSEIGLIENSRKVTAKIVRSETTSVDEISLKKALGARTFNKLCIQRVDKAKLRQAMVTGMVDPVVVAQHTVIKTASPYLRFSEKVVEE